MTESLLQATIDSQFDNVWLLGVTVRAVAAHAGFSAVESLELELAVVEAVNNSIEHAYRGASGHKVELALRYGSAALEFTIFDDGLPVPEGGQLDQLWAKSAEDHGLSEGGRGIAIIKQVMDCVQYRRSGGRNALHLTKRLTSNSSELRQ